MNYGFDEKDSKENETSRESYTSMMSILFQEFEYSSITVKYVKRRAFMDLWLGIISDYLNLDENKPFRQYLSSTAGRAIISGTGVAAQCGQNDFPLLLEGSFPGYF